MNQSTNFTNQQTEQKSSLEPNSQQSGLYDSDQMISEQLESETIKAPIKRRKFLGLSMLGFAGLSSLSSFAGETGNKVVGSLKKLVGSTEKSHWERTEGFQEKIDLLQKAWQKKDFRMVRALTHSLRSSGIQAQAEEEKLGTPVSGAAVYGEVAKLPIAWKNWAKGWTYYKVLQVDETAGIEREKEPIEALLEFNGNQVRFLHREIRVAKVEDGTLREVVSQVVNEIRRGSVLLCNLLFLAESKAKGQQTYIVFYGNNDAELPNYESDLVTTGDGFALDIENEHFKAMLSHQNGQLEKLILKKNNGIDLAVRGNGHGEPPAIDWAHDYQAVGPQERGSFQKLRIASWDKVPDYEIVQGPICTFVRRWGFPNSIVHPLYSPARLNIDIEYRFYSGLPYFLKHGQMTSTKEFHVAALRDDEWLFTRAPFDELIWMNPEGKVKIGEVEKGFENKLWGVGFFNKANQNSFFATYLEHYAEGMPEISHSGSPTLTYGNGINLWARYPLRHTKVPAGAVLHQKNAYSINPFNVTEGPEKLQTFRQALLNPLKVSAGEIKKGIVAKAPELGLARAGEAGDNRISKELIWKALEKVRDGQLYTANVNIVDLGFVYDIRVDRDEVTVVMAMPHRGRPMAGYFLTASAEITTIPQALELVPGVKKVNLEQTWNPLWSVNRITEEGRRKLQLELEA